MTDVTEPLIKLLGEDAECAVCKEHFILGAKMQEMPCKHLFHPECLKPWLVWTLEWTFIWHVFSLHNVHYLNCVVCDGRMSIIHVQYAGMNSGLMIMTMKVRRKGTRNLRRRKKVPRMHSQVESSCISDEMLSQFMYLVCIHTSLEMVFLYTFFRWYFYKHSLRGVFTSILSS